MEKVTRPCRPAVLFVPGLKSGFFRNLPANLGELGGVVIDLEDSIHSGRKAEARAEVRNQVQLLSEIRRAVPNLRVVLRINNRATPDYSADVELALSLDRDQVIDAIMYPKPRVADEIRDLASAIKRTRLFLAVAIETPAGYANFPSILDPRLKVRWCAVGGEDLCAGLDVQRPSNFYDHPLLAHVANEIALHAKGQDLVYLGNIWPYQSLEGAPCPADFEAECEDDAARGATGKFAFQPWQLPLINRWMALPTHDEEKLLVFGRLKAILDRVRADGLSVTIHRGRMVDQPEGVRLRRWMDQGRVTMKERTEIEVLLRELEGSRRPGGTGHA